MFDLALDVLGGILTGTTGLEPSFDIEMPAVPPAPGDSNAPLVQSVAEWVGKWD